MPRRVLVTGASGFVGTATVERLAKDGFKVRAMVRAPRKVPHAHENVVGDVSDLGSLRDATIECDVVIHLVAIIKEVKGATFDKVIGEGTRNIVEAAADAKRIIYISALGTGPSAKGEYYQAKWKAEEAIRASGKPHTILRPSIIFGPGDEFVNQFAGKFVPLPAGGITKLQPVHVRDVAEILSCSALQNIDGAFEVGGPDVLTLRKMIDIAERKYGKKAWHPSIPLGLAKLGAKLVFDPLLRLGINMPAGSGALAMLEQDNVCDTRELRRTHAAFGIDPRSFADTV
jgi:NADH dehydrogenase